MQIQKAVAQRSRIGNMYAHKHERDDRSRIASARLEIHQILKTYFCGQGCYSSIDIINVSCCGTCMFFFRPQIETPPNFTLGCYDVIPLLLHFLLLLSDVFQLRVTRTVTFYLSWSPRLQTILSRLFMADML